MRDLLGKFIFSLTHLDNKFVSMCWQLLVPARVSIHYFQGKIKRYPHPVQFFFIVMFFFLLMFSKQFGGAQLESTGGNFNLKVGTSEPIKNTELQAHLKKRGLWGILEQYDAANQYRNAFNVLPEEWQTPIIQQALDSVNRHVNGIGEGVAKLILELDSQDTTGEKRSRDSLSLSSGFKNTKIAVYDLVHLSPDEIIERYGFETWDEQVTVKQGIKSLKNPQALVRQYIGSFGWAVLVLITIMAFVLRLLYWKQRRYYVEHFIFLMHQQSGAFLLLTLAFVIHEYLFQLDWFWVVIFAWIGISLLLAMKRFYGERWGWTTAKWLFYCALYLVGLIVLFSATLLVVFVIF